MCSDLFKWEHMYLCAFNVCYRRTNNVNIILTWYVLELTKLQRNGGIESLVLPDCSVSQNVNNYRLSSTCQNKLKQRNGFSPTRFKATICRLLRRSTFVEAIYSHYKLSLLHCFMIDEGIGLGPDELYLRKLSFFTFWSIRRVSSTFLISVVRFKYCV